MNINNFYLKHFAFILLIFWFIELFSRYIYIVFPYESHQRYGYINSTKDIHGKFHKLNINGRGAIGELSRGQKIQVAFFGTSALFDGISMNKNWPELFRKYNIDNIHVDNFGFFGTTFQILKGQLESLCHLKRNYDFSVIQMSNIMYEDTPKRYHDRWKPNSKKYQTYQQIKKWYNRNQNIKGYFQKPPIYLIHYLEQIIALKRFYKTQPHLFSKDKNQNDIEINELPFIIKDIIKQAKCISKKVFWIHEPFAYSKSMLSHYNNIVYYSYKLKNKISSEYSFADIESQASFKYKEKNTINNILKEYLTDITFIDLDSWIKKELDTQEGLFVNETHLSEKGHKLALELMLPVFMAYLNVQE